MSRLKKQTKLTKLMAVPGAVILLWLVLILSGCGGPPEPSPKPKVITKKMPVEKIVAPSAQPSSKGDLPETGKKKDEPKKTIKGKPAEPSLPGAVQKLLAVTSGKPLEKKSTGFVATYDPTGKIDPFESFLKKEEKRISPTGEGEKKKKRKCGWEPRPPTTPLEFIDLAQLKLTGIIRAGSGNKALVREATGKGYVIKKGTYIGRNEGMVTQILKDRIIIKECVKNMYDEENERDTELRIEKPPGEF